MTKPRYVIVPWSVCVQATGVKRPTCYPVETAWGYGRPAARDRDHALQVLEDLGRAFNWPEFMTCHVRDMSAGTTYRVDTRHPDAWTILL